MTIASEAKVEILADPEALSHRAAAWLLELATAKGGIFAVCLSGGTTPQRLYERLAEPPYRNTFPWSRTHWFWGDERFVPHDTRSATTAWCNANIACTDPRHQHPCYSDRRA